MLILGYGDPRALLITFEGLLCILEAHGSRMALFETTQAFWARI